jgi:hypothetical protein
MKKTFYALLALCAASATQISYADDYGCRVLLCLAASGATPQECKPTLDKLFRDLARGRSFPSCSMASGDGVRSQINDIIASNPEMTQDSRGQLTAAAASVRDSYALQGYNYYDPCPEGTSALGNGSYAVQGTSLPARRGIWGAAVNAADLRLGIGEGNGVGFSFDDRTLPAKVCVGNFVGNAFASKSDGWRNQTVSVGVYERVVLLDPANSPRIIDVYVNSTLYRRVRW